MLPKYLVEAKIDLIYEITSLNIAKPSIMISLLTKDDLEMMLGDERKELINEIYDEINTRKYS